MTEKSTPVLFITANVGSIFEEPARMLKAWAEEFLSTISRLEPKFVALHCQEVGGKNYEKSMQHVDDLVKLLLASNELRLFDKVRIYLDEDYTCAEKFTALGNFYFIHESVSEILQYDFATECFVDVNGIKVFSHDLEQESTKEKSKFPLEYFPECKWSRKGFLRTRWSINSTIIDLVNIHLFHDASNFVAIESYPSEYSEMRRHALIYTLDRLHTDKHATAPVFIFGDFNFRTDTKAVVSRLSEGLKRTLTEEGTEDTTVDFSDGDSTVLCVGKKTFSHQKHEHIFAESDWLRSYDTELEFFRDQLFEFEVSFQPSYPFEEGETGAKHYMQTRCPAWCDRILLTKDALPLVKDGSDPASVEYGIMGKSTCMGDHKPVYLKTEIFDSTAEKKEHMRKRAIDMLDRKNQDAGDGPAVKRVNSASLVESRDRRQDWQSARCNSDVSWNPSAARSATRAPPMRRSLLHGSSRIRLISPNDSVAHSLPRLTSHHSSSDEDWFEVVDPDDDAIELSTKTIDEVQEPVSQSASTASKEVPEPARSNSDQPQLQTKDHHISILRRLSKQNSDEIIEVAAHSEKDERKRPSRPKHFLVLKTQTLLASVKRKNHPKNEDNVSWETIDLTDSVKDKEVPKKRQHCCVLQ